MSNFIIKPRRIMANLDLNSPTTNESRGTLNSPVTNLAMNLSELTTSRSTPKRRLSLTTVDTPVILSVGCFQDSPTPVDSPFLEYRMKPQDSTMLHSFNSKENNLFSPLCIKPTYMADAFENSSQSSPSEQDDSNSRDSGLGFDKDKEDQFQFVPPLGMPPRKVRTFDEDICQPKKYSPSKFQRSFSVPLIKKEDIEFLQKDNSPKKLDRFCSGDDGFSDHLESMDIPVEAPFSDGIKSLMEAPISSKALDDRCDNLPKHIDSYGKSGNALDNTPNAMRRSQSFDIRRRPKRDRMRDENTPVMLKRRKPVSDDNCTVKLPPICNLKRSYSETEAQIKSAVQKITQNSHLIGDGTKMYCLPTIAGKHGDLKSITAETVRNVILGNCDEPIDSYHLIDCRYPYEYEGGHIMTAENLYTKPSILKMFLASPPEVKGFKRGEILIFHCEFSSERAPNLARFLRNKDRDANKDCYPALYYPEIYILDGGYKAFYESNVAFCEPKKYKPMLHRDHSHDLKHFRAKSKSWAGEKNPRTGLRQLNF